MRSFPIGRHATCLLLTACLACLPAGASGQSREWAGRTLISVLDELREQGLSFIYSSDLVPEALRVLDEPAANAPLMRLAEALAVHGLALQPGPRGNWLIVRLEPQSRPAVEPAPLPPFRPAPPALETIVVSASRYAFSRATATSESRVDRLQLDHAPTLGEDAYRAVHALPGVTSGGISALVNVRGGEVDEALLLIDGVRLYSPFHLKDFQSLFSSISPRVIESIEVRTGAFPAQFGDRMSAVIEMESAWPEDERHYELGVSTLTSSFASSGRFADDHGAWLTSLRRGNLDLLIDAAQSDVGRPQYTDFFTKLSYRITPKLTAGMGFMALNDKISLVDPPVSEARADYDDEYVWLRLDHVPGERFHGRYLFSLAHIERNRNGSVTDPALVIGSLNDTRHSEIDTVKADWSYVLGESQELQWGVAVTHSASRYDFSLTRDRRVPILVTGASVPEDQRTAALRLANHRNGLYAGYRIQPADRFTAELGLRWDAQSAPDEEQLSPRVSLMIDVGDRSTLRASWGRYHQAQDSSELQVADGMTSLSPAQESEHLVLSFERVLGDAVVLRAEAYRKEFERLRPRFENLYSRVSLLPEILPDRVELDPVRGEATGVELSVRGELARWQWWVSLARASAEDDFGNRLASRSWEEPWSAKAGFIRRTERWTTSFGLNVHSGWPISALELDNGRLVAGTYNGTRLEDFRSLDFRASRDFPLKRGSLQVFFELNNMLDYSNPCCLDYAVEIDAGGNPVELSTNSNNWLPSIPTLGLLWQF